MLGEDSPVPNNQPSLGAGEEGEEKQEQEPDRSITGKRQDTDMPSSVVSLSYLESSSMKGILADELLWDRKVCIG